MSSPSLAQLVEVNELDRFADIANVCEYRRFGFAIVDNKSDGRSILKYPGQDWKKIRICENTDTSGLVERVSQSTFTKCVICSGKRCRDGCTTMSYELPVDAIKG